MDPQVEIRISETPSKVAKAAGKALVKMMLKSGQNRFDVALSGGRTPRKLFARLAKKYINEIEWSRIHFWWGDERCVPPDSPESNYKMAYDSMLSHLPVPEENIHRIRGEEDPQKEAERYGQEILSHLNTRGEWPVFDLVILGMGDDGHTASIFPDQAGLLSDSNVCAVAIHPVTKQKRITLTGKVINNANEVFFLVTGKSKAQRMSEIMNNDPVATRYPAYHILPEYGKLIWFIDEEASGRM